MSAERIEDSDDRVTATLSGQIDGVSLTMRVVVPRGIVHPRELLSTYEQMTDAFVEFAISREDAAGRKISCAAGCGACCRQLVPISEIEARHVADLVAALPSARQQVIRDRFAQARQKLQQADWLEPLQDPDRFPKATLSELGLAYFRLGIPCPFLEEESCSIHPDRPLACREYLVTSPAANCAQPSPDTIQQVRVSAKMSTAVIRLSPQTSARFIAYVPLILALDWALPHPDQMQPRPGPEIVQSLVESLFGPIDRQAEDDSGPLSPGAHEAL